VVQLLFWPALLSLPALLGLSLIFEHDQIHAIQNAALASWVGVAYSTVFSSLVGYGLWNRLITRYKMSLVVPYSLLVPVAGITGGVLVFAEPVTSRILLGALLSIIGVGVITLRRPRLAELEQV
jgi:O-acetylserine/cysteine efflux transporter